MSHNVYYVKIFLFLYSIPNSILIGQKFNYLHLSVFPAINITLPQFKNHRGFVTRKT